jgi:2-polyprenyl-6-methoxyphenol hydroxylase-like FAD-dependent oxidoreductase
VLIGDAAHALVPTMGQGANTALEDAVSLGPLLGTDLAAGLAAFDRHRRPRTRAIARRSRLTGRFGAGVQGRYARALRDTALRALPAAAITAAGTRMLMWRPPGVTP